MIYNEEIHRLIWNILETLKQKCQSIIIINFLRKNCYEFCLKQALTYARDLVFIQNQPLVARAAVSTEVFVAGMRAAVPYDAFIHRRRRIPSRSRTSQFVITSTLQFWQITKKSYCNKKIIKPQNLYFFIQLLILR